MGSAYHAEKTLLAGFPRTPFERFLGKGVSPVATGDPGTLSPRPLQLLKKLTKIENISIGAHYHHERFDGRGYPEGLKGEEIPEIARIIAVADTYDAMTSNRSYRNAMSQEKVRSELEKGRGTQFDARFADIMLEIDVEIQELIYSC